MTHHTHPSRRGDLSRPRSRPAAFTIPGACRVVRDADEGLRVGDGALERRGSRGATHHGHGSSAHFESATATRFTGTPLGVHPAQRVRIPPRSNHFPSASRQGMLTTRKTNVKTAASVGTTPMKPHYDDIQAAIEEAEQYLVDSQFRKDRRATHRWKLELRRLKRRGRR